jgi:chromosome segregation ATPase
LQKDHQAFAFVTLKGEVLSQGILFVGKGTHRELMDINEKIEHNTLEARALTQRIADLSTEHQLVYEKRPAAAERLEALNTEFSQTVVALKEDEISYEKKLFEKTSNQKAQGRD